MKLSNEDAQLFYDLWFPLLDYLNEKYMVNPYIGKITGAENVNPAEVSVIAEFLWEKPELIDEYLSENKLSEENKKIVAGWKRRKTGRFVLERNLKKGSIFISEDNEVYLIQGLFSSFEEMFRMHPLPVMMDMTIIPFKDKIITDGLIKDMPLIFGPNFKSDLKECYMSAKKSGKIYNTI